MAGTSSEFYIEAALATDVSNGTKLPINLSWRGGYAANGGLKLTGGSAGELGGNVILHAGNYSSYALPLSGGTLTGTLTMGTSGTQYIRMGRFPNSTTNSGEAWIGRASDRASGTMTVQLGSGNDRSFEVVDYAWTKVIFSADMTSVNANVDLRVNGTGWNSSKFVANASSGSTAEINGTSNTANQSPLYVWNNVESGSTYFISFYSDGQNNARTLRGYINYRRDIATMNLTTASDYRIKTVHGLYTKSGQIFDGIKVHDASIIGEATGHYPMVLAHELQEAYPVAVEGEKDAVNEDGSPKLQMVNYLAMIPLMLAEIKSLRARVAQLENH